MMRAAFFVFLTALSAQAADTIAVTRYHDKDLIPVRTKLRYTTLIVLPPGEEIDEVSCGDKQYWVIEGKDNILHVKPAKEGAVTNVNVVLKSKAVYSFVVEEIGPKGDPDLKLVLGEDEALLLRSEKKALEAKIVSLSAEKDAVTAQSETKRLQAETSHAAALSRVEAEMPARLISFLSKQKFAFWCFSKTEICLASEFSTDTATYVIGQLGKAPLFSGTDEHGKFHYAIPFEQEGNVYKLHERVAYVTIDYKGKLVTHSLK